MPNFLSKDKGIYKVKHEFTATLKPYLYKETAKRQWEATKERMSQLLQGYKASAVGEITKAHNIHYHSIVEIKDIKEKDQFINKIRGFKEFGRFTLTCVQYEESYEQYLKKDIINTATIIGTDPVIKDDYSIFKNLKQINPISGVSGTESPTTLGNPPEPVLPTRGSRGQCPILDKIISPWDQILKLKSFVSNI